jgi:O-Antigen ligase
MIALLLCVLALFGAYFAGRKSLVAGCLVVAAFGYVYGILRANLFSPLSFFIFDAAIIGLYASQFLSPPRDRTQTPPNPAMKVWLIILIGWPSLMLFLPFQNFMVSLVGLRGNMFLLPVLLLGSRLRSIDLYRLAIGLAFLNLFALTVGVAEYFKGIEPFFPYSPVTVIMYNSLDSGHHYRIPSTFSAAHAYAATLVSTIPFLFGAWAQKLGSRKEKLLLLLGLASALFGVLLASTRSNLVTASLLMVVAILSGKVTAMKRAMIAIAIAAVIIAALSNERFQRYKEFDSDSVSDRIAGSVNQSFWEILAQYPMGNGLGGGGTSIPYFLASQVKHPVGLENEYSRILLEQGVIGLLMWVGFVLWFLSNRSAFVKDTWHTGRKMAWIYGASGLISASLGVGLLTSIPHSFFFLLIVGWVSSKPQAEGPAMAPARRARGLAPRTVAVGVLR